MTKKNPHWGITLEDELFKGLRKSYPRAKYRRVAMSLPGPKRFWQNKAKRPRARKCLVLGAIRSAC
jgi:hypothetical protein